MSKENYLSQKVQTAAAIKNINIQISEVDTQSENTSEIVESHKPFFGQDILTREMVQALIKEVRVTTAEQIEIVWKFTECYQELQERFMP